eukprot:12888089-Prorocentrum_lima.AAC.1
MLTENFLCDQQDPTQELYAAWLYEDSGDPAALLLVTTVDISCAPYKSANMASHETNAKKKWSK